MPVLKIKEDGEWKKVSNVNMLSVGQTGDLELPENARLYYVGTAEGVLDADSMNLESSAVGQLVE